MAKMSVLGLFREAEVAARGVEGLERVGLTREEYEILSGTPYPEGAFGEKPIEHRLYFFPLVGAAMGFSVALLLTMATQLYHPIMTGGKPILSIPPMFIITYEGTLLGAIIFTILGIIFESRLPRVGGVGLYDRRITEGYVGLLVTCPEERRGLVEQVLKEAGAEEIKESRLG